MMRKVLCTSGVFAAASMLVLAGCAKKPEAEIEQAQNALAKAKQAEAPVYAPAAFSRAEQKVQDGMSLVDRKKYTDAAAVLVEGADLAEKAARDAEAAKMQAMEEESAGEEEAQQEEEAARSNSHTVVRGECLWYIAGYSHTYGDPYQWTTIYNANKDQIDNPDLIYPGQTFRLP